MDQKIVLDGISFKALAAGSRVSIMKILCERRKTLSELSRQLSLGASTVKEHCDILRNAGLIDLTDEGRKWKYYSLTKKGQQIIAPQQFEEAKVLVMLCIGALAFSAFLFILLQSQATLGTQGGNVLSTNKDLAGAALPAAVEEKMLSTNTPLECPNISPPEKTIDPSLLAEIVAVTLIFGLTIGWFARGKK
jgi:DNA-binding transcriptional ArsR family regulator